MQNLSINVSFVQKCEICPEMWDLSRNVGFVQNCEICHKSYQQFNTYDLLKLDYLTSNLTSNVNALRPKRFQSVLPPISEMTAKSRNTHSVGRRLRRKENPTFLIQKDSPKRSLKTLFGEPFKNMLWTTEDEI